MIPSKSDLKTIYSSLLGGHLTGFAPKVMMMTDGAD